LPGHLEGREISPLLKDPKSAWDSAAITTHGRNNHTVRTEGWRYIRYADGGEELYDEAADPLSTQPRAETRARRAQSRARQIASRDQRGKPSHLARRR
jgi:hypothetical protein